MTHLKDGVGVLLLLFSSLLLLVGSKTHAEVQEHYIGDDGNVHIPLQFPFPYYGRTFTDSWMFSNGVVGFLAPGASFCCTGQDLSNPNAHNPVWNFALMPLWTDLRNYNGRFLTEGTPDYQRYVWENISEFGRPGSENTFGVEIFPSGDWRFYHEKIDITRPFTIGATGDLSKGEYQQFQYYPQGLQDYNYGYQWDSTNPWTPTYNGDPNPVNICDVDPLADPSCPNYEQAYFENQCSFDPLYDPACPGYADAYYNQQCYLNPLYDSGCNGYEQAYYNQQCGLDPLYDSGCDGYEQAYYNQQCGLDPLYDAGCDGYEEAVVNAYVTPNETTSSQETISSISETAVPVTDPEEIGLPSTTGDSTIDSILNDLSDSQPIATLVTEPSTDMAPEPNQEEPQEETQEEELASVEITDVETETQSDESDAESGTDDTESSDESEGETVDGGDSESEEKDSKRERVKKAIAKKAQNLANEIANAASLQAQQAAQQQVLALINYVPDFNTYQRQMNGGYLPDATGYPESEVPESRRGLRNGLAQQLLHQQMVDMQYNKENKE